MATISEHCIQEALGACEEAVKSVWVFLEKLPEWDDA